MIPAVLRKRYGLQPGDRVALVDYGGALAIVPKLAADPHIQVARGLLKGEGSLVDALRTERNQERRRER